ncbi:unnamed protein product [Dibothriocephalus latus]|uniref:Uncharacterized protein n=1 Tax=Dibothriocephalus latus TaxID=60516 RepID=A0A3P7LQD8_DIBLA|nr:unnamed protein product [Dibothriocephalus latus]
MAFRLHKLHRPPTRAQRTYPLPSNLSQPLYHTPALLYSLLPQPVLINAAHPADKRNDANSMFAADSLNEFGLRDASWTELKKASTFESRDPCKPPTLPIYDAGYMVDVVEMDGRTVVPPKRAAYQTQYGECCKQHSAI